MSSEIRRGKKCIDCYLGTINNTINNHQGFGNPEAKLILVMQSPGDDKAEQLLIWICKKLGLGADDIWIEYLTNCALPHVGKLKKAFHKQCYAQCWNSHPRISSTRDVSLVFCGTEVADFLADTKLNEMHGKKNELGIWFIYSFQYLLMSPAECVEVWRVLYKAAEEAGLKPHMVADVPDFIFPSKKIR